MGNLQVVQVPKPGIQSVWCEDKISNCPWWPRCVQHVQNLHYLHDPKDFDEAVASRKAHCDNLKDRKARLRRVEIRFQGQSTLDEYMEEYGHGSAEKKHCMANVARLCAVEDLPFHIGTKPGFMKFMRQWDPQWPSMSKQSVKRSVERQSEELWKDIKGETEGVATETWIAFTTGFWMSPTGESFNTRSMH